MDGPEPEDVARFLRQRVELGAPSLVFEAGTRDAVLAAPRGRGARARLPVAGVAVAAPASARATAPRPAVERPSTAAGPAPSGAPVSGDYDGLRSEALACTRCRLSDGRTHVVFADGNPTTARVMVVGEAPGANEDRTGLPFVGAAGKLLDLLLASIDLSRQASVYICNVIKCRPPENRNPLQDEIDACSPYLLRQIELVRPEVILAVGTFAAQLLSGSTRPIGSLRGEIHSYGGTPLVVTYHPAALLRNPGWTRATWDDLQLLAGILDRGRAA